MSRRSKRGRRSGGTRRATTATAPAAPAATATAAATPAPAAAAPAPPRPDADEPAFWFDFTVPWTKLALARFVLFGVLAVEGFLQIRHGARYGTGFNVAHLRVLDDAAPGRVAFVVSWLVLSYVLILFALGVALRLIPVAALAYGWLYFSSELDSYQHHYLVFLVLVLASFVRWRRPDGAAPDEPPPRSWAIRLILVQVGVMYAWAAIAKLHGYWLDGTALSQQIGTPWIRHLVGHVPGGWATTACTVLALEAFLSVAVWCRRLWPVAFPLGIAFHAGIAMSNLQIGLFSYVMFGLWLLAVPDRWVEAAAGAIAGAVRGVRRLGASATDHAGRRPWSLVAVALAPAAIAWLFSTLPFDRTTEVGVVVGIAVATIAVAARFVESPRAAGRTLGVGLVAAAALAGLGRTTSTAVEYYRYWAGDARVRGHDDVALDLYRRVLELEPDDATSHYRLGRIELRAGHEDLARDHLRAAERLRPGDARPYLALAEWLGRKERFDEALAAARNAERVAPGEPRPYLSEAAWLARQGHADQALAAVRKAERVAPRDPTVVQMLHALGRAGVGATGAAPVHPSPAPGGAAGAAGGDDDEAAP
jgi:HTTM domain